MPDQVDWFRQENFNIALNDSSKGKGFLFFHIPIYEYTNLYNDHAVFGKMGEKISCQGVNTGLFHALKEQKTIEYVSVGHDHNNDYYGTYE